MNKKKLRRKIADQVQIKMAYICTCPNEQDIILNIILPKKDRYKGPCHCNTDCWNSDCVSHKNYSGVQIPPPRSM